MKIDGFNILPIASLSMEATTFTAQNYGNHQIDRVYKGMKVTLLVTLLYRILTGVCLFNFSHPILSLFTQDLQVIQATQVIFHYFYLFLLAPLHSLAGTIHGFSKTVPPMLILMISLYIFKIA